MQTENNIMNKHMVRVTMYGTHQMSKGLVKHGLEEGRKDARIVVERYIHHGRKTVMKETVL